MECCIVDSSYFDRRITDDYLKFQIIVSHSVLNFESGRPKRLLILVNPYGGKRLAPTMFRNEVKPLLDAAGICYSMQGFFFSILSFSFKSHFYLHLFPRELIIPPP